MQPMNDSHLNCTTSLWCILNAIARFGVYKIKENKDIEILGMMQNMVKTAMEKNQIKSH